VSLAILWFWELSPGESLDPELDRHDCGVLDVVSLVGASCLETRLGGLCGTPPVFAAVHG
jgi:hypothetical protein